MRQEKGVLVVMGIVSAILIGFLVGRRCDRNAPGDPVSPRVDTLLIRDTFKVTEPKKETIKVVDSVLVPVTDTIRVTDTLYVILERQQVIWEDSLARVYSSGIDPHVDSVIHFTGKMVITREIPVIEVKNTRWGLGVQAGVGAGKDGLTPYLGVGVSYNLLSW